MDKNTLKKLSKKTVPVKNVSRTPLWYTKQTGKLDGSKPLSAIEEHTKKLFCNYLSAAKKLTVYFLTEMAEAQGIVGRGNLAEDTTGDNISAANCTTEAEKRRYENMVKGYMAEARENQAIRTAAADAQAFIDAANEILFSRIDSMRKNTLAHIHAYLSGVCSKNGEVNIDLAQCFKECMINIKEDEAYDEKDFS